MRPALCTALLFGVTLSCLAQEPAPTPVELEVLRGSIGVWDAQIEVWPQGPDAVSIKFSGVETNRAYGEYWIASDLDSEFMGQTIRAHSIVGYDVDQKKLVGMVVDDGVHAANMTGDYDQESNMVSWTTHAKDANGKPMLQKTTTRQTSATERLLVLSVPGKEEDEFTKFMQIRFVKRQ